jgi:segregation and condensation protein A
VDLITAGRLLVMAWTILRMQSDKARLRAEPPPPPPPPEPEDPWFGVEAATEEDADYAFTHGVIEGTAPLDEKVRHHGDRKVTLFELVEALEEARLEAEVRIQLNADREAARVARRIKAGGSVHGQVHKEDQERDVAEVWERILGRNGHPIPLDDLHAKNRDDLVKTFVSVLFLARQNRLKIWQENFPYGTIYVQNAEKAAHGDGPQQVSNN